MKFFRFKAVQRQFLKRKLVYLYAVFGAMCSVLFVVGRWFLSDCLYLVMSPPIGLILFGLFITVIISLKKNYTNLLFVLAPIILNILLVVPVYYFMLCFFPTVITQFSASMSQIIMIQYGIDIVFFLYFIIVHFLICTGRNLKNLIIYNTRICVLFSIYLIFLFIFADIIPFLSDIAYVGSFKELFTFLLQYLFSVNSHLIAFFSINIIVSLETFSYLSTKNFLDEFI